MQHSGDSNASAAYGAYYTFNDSPIAHRWEFAFRNGGVESRCPSVPFIDQENITGRHFITTMYDTLTLNHGKHAFTLGRKLPTGPTGRTPDEIFQVPTLWHTALPAGDPLQVSTAFTTATLPGINSTELGNPLALYNLLTGRVSAANFTRVVNPETLKYDGFINFTWTRSFMGGAYVQDRWRIKPTLTLNYGLRWEVQGPMHDVKKSRLSGFGEPLWSFHKVVYSRRTQWK